MNLDFVVLFPCGASGTFLSNILSYYSKQVFVGNILIDSYGEILSNRCYDAIHNYSDVGNRRIVLVSYDESDYDTIANMWYSKFYLKRFFDQNIKVDDIREWDLGIENSELLKMNEADRETFIKPVIKDQLRMWNENNQVSNPAHIFPIKMILGIIPGLHSEVLKFTNSSFDQKMEDLILEYQQANKRYFSY